jgi:hypothetical protein
MLVHLKLDNSGCMSIFVKAGGPEKVDWNPGWQAVTTVYFDQPKQDTCAWLHQKIIEFPQTKGFDWHYDAMSWNCQNAADDLCQHLFNIGAPGWSLTNTFEGFKICATGTFWTIFYFVFFLFFGVLMVIILPSVRIAPTPTTIVLCEVLDGFSTCTIGSPGCALPDMAGCYLRVKYTNPFDNKNYTIKAPVNPLMTNGNCNPNVYWPWTWYDSLLETIFKRSGRYSPCCDLSSSTHFRGYAGTNPLIECDTVYNRPKDLVIFPLHHDWKFSNMYLDIPDHLKQNSIFIASIFIATAVFFWAFLLIHFYRFILSKCPACCCIQNYTQEDWLDTAAPSATLEGWQFGGLLCLLMLFVQVMVIEFVPKSEPIYSTSLPLQPAILVKMYRMVPPPRDTFLHVANCRELVIFARSGLGCTASRFPLHFLLSTNH